MYILIPTNDQQRFRGIVYINQWSYTSSLQQFWMEKNQLRIRRRVFNRRDLEIMWVYN